MNTHEELFSPVDPKVAQYVYDLFQPEDEVLQEARVDAQRRGLPPIRMGAFDARHLEILVRLMGAKKAVEIGTNGGYSGISIARGLGAGGRLHTFDLDPHHVEVANQAFLHAGLLAEVIVHSGPALENLPRIVKEAPFDLVFINADPPNYLRYLSWATNHLHVGGAIIADTAFAGGKIHQFHDLKPEDEKAVAAMREFNHIVATSGRFRSTVLPAADGLTIAIKVS